MKKLSGILTLAALAVLVASPVFAASQLSDSVDNVRNNLTRIPMIINFAAYIIGFALAVAGVGKLKAHVDNPGNNPIKDGLGRVGAAALFISIPFLLDMIRETQNLGSSSASYISVNELSN